MKLGIIGGSGLEKLNIFNHSVERHISTPYGEPSSTLLEGEISGVSVAILSRHGREHTITPTRVNNRANIYALKKLGCTHILATTACGSLRENIKRGDIVIADQFIDFTRHRRITFYDKFEPGHLKHTPMSDPFNATLRTHFIKTAQDMNIGFHQRGTIVTIEGPRFSTRAESKMFRIWGGDIINMSTAPEVILANEIGIPYAAIALATDYDCWHDDEEPVTWEAVFEIFNSKLSLVTELLVKTVELLGVTQAIEAKI